MANTSKNTELIDANQKPYRKLTLLGSILLIIFIALIIFLFVYYLYAKQGTPFISEENLSSGVSIYLNENQKAEFIVNNEKHLIVIDNIKQYSVNVIVYSSAKEIEIKLNEEAFVDLNDDTEPDVAIKVESLSLGEKVNIRLRKTSPISIDNADDIFNHSRQYYR